MYIQGEWFEVVNRLFVIAEKEFQPEAFFVAGREIDDSIISIGSTILGVISSYVVDLNNRFWDRPVHVLTKTVEDHKGLYPDGSDVTYFLLITFAPPIGPSDKRIFTRRGYGGLVNYEEGSGTISG